MKIKKENNENNNNNNVIFKNENNLKNKTLILFMENFDLVYIYHLVIYLIISKRFY